MRTGGVRMLGLQREDLIGRTAADFLDSDVIFTEAWADFLTNGSWTGEIGFRRENGCGFRAEFAARANIVPGRHLWTVRGVTERKRLEEHIRQVQRLEAVGPGRASPTLQQLLTISWRRRVADGGAARHRLGAAGGEKQAAGRVPQREETVARFSRRHVAPDAWISAPRCGETDLQRLWEIRFSCLSDADGLPAVCVDQHQFGS